MSPAKWLPLLSVSMVGAFVAVHAQRPQTEPPPPRHRHLFTAQHAYLLMTPELVAGPTVTWVQWSPDGRHVLAVRESVRSLPVLDKPAGEIALVAWSARSRRARDVWSKPLGSVTFEQGHWLGSTGVALAVVSGRDPAKRERVEEEYRTLQRVDARTGLVRPLGELAPGDQLVGSPVQPVAVVVKLPAPKFPPEPGRPVQLPGSLTTFNADGTHSRPVVLPPGWGGAPAGWSRDGTVLYFGEVVRPVPPSKTFGQRWHAFDTASGKMTAVSAEPVMHEPRRTDLPFRVNHSRVAVQEKESRAQLRPLWLESPVQSEQPRVLVAGDAQAALPAPDGSAMLYLSEGAAWVVPVERRPKAEVMAAIREAQRQVATSNAKQIGMALMMYAQDYDEHFPPKDAAVHEVVAPYAPSRSLFNNPATDRMEFVFLGAGSGALADIEAPADHRLGYLPGPGGRAVLYADGHVKWEPDR